MANTRLPTKARQVAPQWGRSAVATPPNGPVAQQLVRLELPHAQDVAVAFQGRRDSTSYLPAQYRVTVGAGGIALFDGQLYVPAVGMVQHFVADHVDVIGMLPASGIAGDPKRIGACVALAQTRENQQIGGLVTRIPVPGSVGLDLANIEPTSWGWTRIETANNALFRVPLWATSLQIAAKGIVATLPAEMVVREVSSTGGVLVATRTVADYASGQPLDPQTWFIEVDCTAAAGIFYAILNFTTRT